MKRYLSYFLLTACILTSCNEAVNPEGPRTDGEKMPITVSASAESMSGTRSNMIFGTDDIISKGKSIGLFSYAQFNGGDEYYSVLDDAEMNYSASNWSYAPVQYWLTSADKYFFAALYPFVQNRFTPYYTFPDPSKEYVLSLQPNVYPMYEKWAGCDYAHGIIAEKVSTDLYLTNPTEDIMFGETEVSPADFGKNVTIKLGHAATAVRFRIRNLSEQPVALTNWFMTGLKNHADLAVKLIGCPEEYDPLRFMSIVQDNQISELKVAYYNANAQDSVKFTGDSDWTIPGDAGQAPGHPDYYKYVLLASRLKETGASKGISHTHSEDGTTVTYHAGGVDYTDRLAFVASAAYQTALNEVKSTYSTTFPHYSQHIFWGPALGSCVDAFFIPLIFERGAQILDFDQNRVRDDAGDYALKIHQFECRSHMFEQSTGVWKANGGLYMPVAADKYANLYSPYFFSAEKIVGGSIVGDWKEGMGTTRWNDADPNHNENADGKQRSVFLWTADNTTPTTPLLLTNCIANETAGNHVYTTSVQGGDLKDVLDESGYILMYPQDIDNLEFNFFTAPDVNNTGNPATASYTSAPDCHKVSLKKYTPGGEWLSGYAYDYVITIAAGDISMQVFVKPWNEREIKLD